MNPTGRNISIKRALSVIITLACVIILGAIYFIDQATDKAPVRFNAVVLEPGIFKLHQVLAVDLPNIYYNQHFLRGQYVKCQFQPYPEVKAYPAFTSQTPIYGSVRLGEIYGQTNTGMLYHFAIDESGGTGKGYDRLYIDHNRDMNLSNERIVRRQKHPSQRVLDAMNMTNIKEQHVFEEFELHLNDDSSDSHGVEIMTRLTLAGDDKKTNPWMSFIRTHVSQGGIFVDGESFNATLGNDCTIQSGLDAPYSALVLNLKDRPHEEAFSWSGGNRLAATHKIHDRFFTFSANPTGDRLTVRPYTNDLGFFEVARCKQSNTQSKFTGSLYSEVRTVPIGGTFERGQPVTTNTSQVPAGDYWLNYLRVDYGNLKLTLLKNYHSEGKYNDRGGRPWGHGIVIRKDKPCVLNFSNKPDVMFVSPTNSQRLKLGDTLQIAALLVEPQFDVIIARLVDTTRMESRLDGKPMAYPSNLALNPKVIITRLNGEKVAEGVMPFG